MEKSSCDFWHTVVKYSLILNKIQCIPDSLLFTYCLIISLMNKKLVYLLLICSFFFFLGLLVHQHKDGVPHDTCIFCYHISHDSLLILQNSPQISLLSSILFFISVENTLGSEHQYYNPYSNRPPPIRRDTTRINFLMCTRPLISSAMDRK